MAGKTKLTHLGRIIPEWLAPRVERCREFQAALASILKIDREISDLLSKLREEETGALDDGP